MLVNSPSKLDPLSLVVSDSAMGITEVLVGIVVAEPVGTGDMTAARDGW